MIKRSKKIIILAMLIVFSWNNNQTEAFASEQIDKNEMLNNNFSGWDGEAVSNAEDIFDNIWKNTYPILDGVEEQRGTPPAELGQGSTLPGGGSIGMLSVADVVGSDGMMMYRKINGKTYSYWNQGDFGGAISSSGCGPTSLAIILSNDTGKPVDPRKMWDLSVSRGASNASWGSNGHGLAEILQGYGYSTEFTIDHEKAREHLKNGGKVLASVGGSDTYTNLGRKIAPWHHFRYGHYVVYAGLTSGGDYETLDPGWREYTGITGKGLVTSSTKAYWLISKDSKKDLNK